MPERLSTLELPIVSAAQSRVTKAAVVFVACLHGIFIFFAAVSFPKGIYNSPDETANAFFAQQIRQAGTIRASTLIKSAPDFVVPRSVKRDGDAFIPVGFVSFPTLFGLLAKVFGVVGTILLTAILSGLSVGAWYGVVRRIFGVTIGLFSAILYGFHPAVLYWGARSFYPHAWFISMSIFALYFLGRTIRLRHERGVTEKSVLKEAPTIAQPLVKKYASAFLAGLTAALSVVLRPPEGLWLIPIFIAVLIFRPLRRRVSVVLLILGGLLPIFAVLALQSMLYGSPLKTGYPASFQPNTIIDAARILVTPFGFDFGRTAQVGWEYLIELFWWYALPFTLGLVAIFMRQSTTSRKMRLWSLAVLLLTLFFLQFYGSWLLRDRLDLAPSLGTSFTRYFLPLYLLSTPIAAYGLRVLQFRRYGKLLTVCACMMFLFFSMRLLLWSADENIIKLASVLRENGAVRQELVERTTVDAIILTERSDKIIFPYREVVARFRELKPEQFEELKLYPLYYETILNSEDIAQENENFWSRIGLRAVGMIPLPGRHRLYKLESL